MHWNALLLSLFVFSLPAQATQSEVTVDGDGAVTWQAGIDGVEIEWHPDGSVRRISSRYSTPVEFADRRGLAKAQVIAEEKAKGGIIRFMDQSVTSTRVIAEVQSDINRATQTRETGQAAHVRKVDERVIMESLTEVTSSYASGNLRGVIVLERGYDETLQEAWVVVGISDKTIAAARGMQQIISDSPRATPGEGNSGISVQRSEVRKGNQQDW